MFRGHPASFYCDIVRGARGSTPDSVAVLFTDQELSHEEVHDCRPLIAAQVYDRGQPLPHRRLPLSTLFRGPTIAQPAVLLEQPMEHQSRTEELVGAV
jgi:hypothetical protein